MPGFALTYNALTFYTAVSKSEFLSVSISFKQLFRYFSSILDFIFNCIKI